MLDIVNMLLDRDNLFKLGLTACALGISIFVLWGPRISRRGTKGSLVGLQNLGLTCFLNSLLQALASCPIFLDWLNGLKGNGRVTDSLLTILTLLGYERSKHNDYLEDDVATPKDLISALFSHGWSIPPQEQDTHELFLLLITSLEEEDQKANFKANSGSLVDALDGVISKPKITSKRGRVNEEEREVELGEITVNEKEGVGNGENEIGKQLTSHLVTSHGDVVINNDKEAPLKVSPKNLSGCSNVKRLVNGSVWKGRSLVSPFRGYLTTQLQCLSCGYKSPMHYDKFDSLSLHLPPGRDGDVRLKELLDALVRCEVLDFICDKCSTKGSKDVKSEDNRLSSRGTRALKTVRIGKLPKCLCLHISRSNMTKDGVVYKKLNYVDFPEFLPMGSFTVNTYVQELKEAEGNADNGSMKGELEHARPSDSQEGNNNRATTEVKQNSHSQHCNGYAMKGCKNMYRLKAVIEHKGSVENGHFVTYRRGPVHSNIRHRSCPSRWYFTSDADVRSSSLCDTLLANAYMIFYERCSSL